MLYRVKKNMVSLVCFAYMHLQKSAPSNVLFDVGLDGLRSGGGRVAADDVAGAVDQDWRKGGVVWGLGLAKGRVQPLSTLFAGTAAATSAGAGGGGATASNTALSKAHISQNSI